MLLYSLRLFVVGGEHIAMAMVVVGHICTWLYTTLSTTYKLCCHGNMGVCERHRVLNDSGAVHRKSCAAGGGRGPYTKLCAEQYLAMRGT